MVVELASKVNRTHPLVSSCLTYGSLTGLAEFSQQTILLKLYPASRNEPTQKYDLLSVAR